LGPKTGFPEAKKEKQDGKKYKNEAWWNTAGL